MLTLLAAITLTAAPGTQPPALDPAQATALRCGAVFARGARMQADHRPAAAGWPPLATRGREYFVRVTARLMDDTGASRETIAALAAREAASLENDAAVAGAMPACLPLLGAAGL